MSNYAQAAQTSDTTLHPPWLNIARVTWVVLTLLATLVMIAGTAIALNEPLPSCTTTTASCGPWSFTSEDQAQADELGWPGQALAAFVLLSFQLPKLAFLAVALLIFLRRSDDWMALLLSGMLALFALEGVNNLGPVQPLVAALYLLVTLLFTLLPFIFPNGRVVPRWMRWPLLPLLAAAGAVSLVSPLGIPVNAQAYGIALFCVYGLWFLFAGYAAVFRYRRVSTAVERQQTKWVLAGILGTFFGFIPLIVLNALYPPSEPSPERLAFFLLIAYPIILLSYLFMPTAIAFAILRYRLWDIDVIIRKTLLYALLTALLALVYFGTVVLLQGLFERAMGAQQPLVIVASTLLIAALFVPLRRYLQTAIDRRFYRRKYDAQQVLAAFAGRAQQQVELEQLRNELVQVLDSTVQPVEVGVWLKG